MVLFFKKINEVCYGEIIQDTTIDPEVPLTIDECIEIASAKTGALFGLSYATPAIIMGLEPKIVQEIEDLGTLYGTIYQLLDDYNDILVDARLIIDNKSKLI